MLGEASPLTFPLSSPSLLDCEYDSETVMYRMQRQCDKKEHCVIHTSEAMFGAFGDNYTKCDGFTKYINMTYECIGKLSPHFVRKSICYFKHLSGCSGVSFILSFILKMNVEWP